MGEDEGGGGEERGQGIGNRKTGPLDIPVLENENWDIRSLSKTSIS